MAFKADMRKIMLTCFKHNPAAQKFFKGALKYEIDETCPADDVYEQFDYEVSKLIVYIPIKILGSEGEYEVQRLTIDKNFTPFFLNFYFLDCIKIQ